MRRKKAFTLIELLVVIAIIAVLLAIIMPALKKVKEQAKAVVCLFNVKNLSIGHVLYAEQNDDRLVPGNTGGWSPPVTTGYDIDPGWTQLPEDDNGNPAPYGAGAGPRWLEYALNGIENGLLYPYVETTKVYQCPADRRVKDNMGYRSYAIADCMNGIAWNDTTGWVARKSIEIQSPGQKYVFVEENDVRGANIGTWLVTLPGMDPIGEYWGDALVSWHSTKGILGFADGHGESIKWKDKRTLDLPADVLLGTAIRRQPDNVDLQYMTRGWQKR